MMNYKKIKMNIGSFMLHGAPCSGKKNIKQLVLNKPLTTSHEDNTLVGIIRMVAVDNLHLGEMYSKDTTIQRILQREVYEEVECLNDPAYSKCMTSFVHQNFSDKKVPPSRPNKKSPINQPFSKDLVNASNLNFLKPDMPSFLHCHHAHLIDLDEHPHLLRSVSALQSHHIVAIRLDTKLHDKIMNGVHSNIIEADSNYQLIERVCQIAKHSGTNSCVFVIGTHFDKESKEESLSEKNCLLKPLLLRFQRHLVHAEAGKVIFAVNAISTGEDRVKYGRMLQKSLLNAPFLNGHNTDATISCIFPEIDFTKQDEEQKVYSIQICLIMQFSDQYNFLYYSILTDFRQTNV